MIVQIIPAAEMSYVMFRENGEHMAIPVHCWALVEDDFKRREVVPMVAEGKQIRRAEDTSRFGKFVEIIYVSDNPALAMGMADAERLYDERHAKNIAEQN